MGAEVSNAVDETLDAGLGALELPHGADEGPALDALRALIRRKPALDPRYRLSRELGRGGMGSVWLAKDERLGRDVAIKRLHSASSLARKRLAREARVMAQLSHPNVVAVFDVSAHADEPYIVMEYIEGETLREALEAIEASAWRRKLSLLQQAGRGLAAAHALGLVHLDFKPANAMFTRGGVVKVLDFGLAKPDAGTRVLRTLPKGTSMEEQLTETGAVMGTPAYMAPEQHHAEQPGPAADQYALAVSMWEALYSMRPFNGATTTALLDAKLENEPKRSAAVDVPIAVEHVLRRALAPRPEDRWSSVRVFLTALRKAQRRRGWAKRLLGAAAVVAALTYGVLKEPVAAEPPPEAEVTSLSAFAQARIDALEPTLASYERGLRAIRTERERAEIDAILTEARALGDPATLARALRIAGADQSAANADRRSDLLKDSYVLFAETGDEFGMARTAMFIVQELSNESASLREIEGWVDAARSGLRRSGEGSNLQLAVAESKALLDAGAPHEALDVIEGALDLAEPDREQTGVYVLALERRASAYFDLRLHRTAAEAYREVGAFQQSRGEAGDLDVMMSEAVAWNSAGERDRAIEVFDAVVRGIEDGGQVLAQGEELVLLNAARAYFTRPNRVDDAIALLEPLLERIETKTIFDRRFTDDLITRTLFSLAEAHERAGHVEQAGVFARRAAAKASVVFGEDDFKTGDARGMVEALERGPWPGGVPPTD